ncbi:MAG: hypothetical protein H0U85_01465 [Gemmatimonadales bacterium]|nr:hypothetical protein [Gemmatimonadales bacterium]
MSWKACAALALMCIVTAGCGDGGPGVTDPTAGIVRVILATPNADDGALIVTITGAPVSQVEPASSAYQVYSAQPDSLTTRVLLTGNITPGELLRLHVPDVRRAGAYHAVVTQAASGATFAQQQVGSYSLTVAQ